MKDGPAFQLYASDFYMDTTGWTCTQVGIYFRLLMKQWVDGSISTNTEELARVAQIDHGNFLKCYRPLIEGKFVLNGDGNLINKRLEEVREKQRKYRKSQKEKAQTRWQGYPTKEDAGAYPKPMPMDIPNPCSSSSILKNNNKEAEKCQTDAETPKSPKRKWFKNHLNNFVCTKCQKEFMEYQNLTSHLKEHYGEKNTNGL